MQFNSTRSADYISAADAVMKNMEAGYRASRGSSPDFTDIAKTSIEARSKERRALAVAKTNIKKQKMQSETDIKELKIQIKSDKEVGDIMRPAKRMAGMVGALGSLSKAYTFGQEEKIRKKENAARELRDKRRHDEMMALLNQKNDGLNVEDILGPRPSGVKPTGSDSESDQTEDTSEPSPPVASAKISDPNTGQYSGSNKKSKQEIREAALRVGFTPEQASTVVGIAGGESTYDAFNDTKKSGLYKRDGEDSVGIMQINWGYHSKNNPDFLKRLGVTKREQLYDLNTNLKVAKALHDQYGDFRDWTVWKDGSYKGFM